MGKMGSFILIIFVVNFFSLFWFLIFAEEKIFSIFGLYAGFWLSIVNYSLVEPSGGMQSQ